MVSCRWFVCSLPFIILASAVGCGPPPMQSVQGVVKLDGKPVDMCKVGFFPDTEVFDSNRHGFGFGVTDAEGKYTMQHPQGDEGIWAGKYKVTLVAWVDSSGKPLGIDTKPSEVPGGVKNRFAEEYESPGTTPERAVVTKDNSKNIFNFDITSTKSK